MSAPGQCSGGQCRSDVSLMPGDWLAWFSFPCIACRHQHSRMQHSCPLSVVGWELTPAALWPPGALRWMPAAHTSVNIGSYPAVEAGATYKVRKWTAARCRQGAAISTLQSSHITCHFGSCLVWGPRQGASVITRPLIFARTSPRRQWCRVGGHSLSSCTDPPPEQASCCVMYHCNYCCCNYCCCCIYYCCGNCSAAVGVPTLQVMLRLSCRDAVALAKAEEAVRAALSGRVFDKL